MKIERIPAMMKYSIPTAAILNINIKANLNSAYKSSPYSPLIKDIILGINR